MRKAIKSDLSLADGIPANAMALPGANADGFASHLSRLAADHFHVALDDKAEE